jgi:hypothetical protein
MRATKSPNLELFSERTSSIQDDERDIKGSGYLFFVFLENMNSNLRNDVHNLSDNTYVRSKIYLKFLTALFI